MNLLAKGRMCINTQDGNLIHSANIPEMVTKTHPFSPVPSPIPSLARACSGRIWEWDKRFLVYDNVTGYLLVGTLSLLALCIFLCIGDKDNDDEKEMTNSSSLSGSHGRHDGNNQGNVLCRWPLLRYMFLLADECLAYTHISVCMWLWVPVSAGLLFYWLNALTVFKQYLSTVDTAVTC